MWDWCVVGCVRQSYWHVCVSGGGGGGGGGEWRNCWNIVIPLEVSKPQNWQCDLSFRFEIWQDFRQYFWRIPERPQSDKLNSHVFFYFARSYEKTSYAVLKRLLNRTQCHFHVNVMKIYEIWTCQISSHSNEGVKACQKKHRNYSDSK